MVAELREAEFASAKAKAEEIENAQPFNQPSAAADFEYWAKMSYWSVDEAVALSFGKSPIHANPKVLQPNVASRFALLFNSRRALFARALEMGQLYDKTLPTVMLAWAQRMQIDFPSALADAVERIGGQIADWKSLFDKMKAARDEALTELSAEREGRLSDMRERKITFDEFAANQRELIDGYNGLLAGKDEQLGEQRDAIAELNERLVAQNESAKESDRPLQSRERESLLKLVLGLAIKGYGYNAKAGRASQTKEIADDLAALGMPLDVDTVRKYLSEAKPLLPPDLDRQ